MTDPDRLQRPSHGEIVPDDLSNAGLEPRLDEGRSRIGQAAALSSGLLVGMALLGLTGWAAAVLAALAGFALRGLAIHRGWSLPAYRD